MLWYDLKYAGYFETNIFCKKIVIILFNLNYLAKLVFLIILLLFILYYNVNFLSFLILTEFLIITVLFYIIDNEINIFLLFLIFLVFSICGLVLDLSLLKKN